jgi:hypothetical protein
MRRIKTIRQLTQLLQKHGAVLPGSLSRLTQRGPRKGSSRRRAKTYWYLTWKEGGRSKALYIPSGEVARVAQGVENMKRIREFILEIGMENLMQLKEERDVGQKG